MFNVELFACICNRSRNYTYNFYTWRSRNTFYESRSKYRARHRSRSLKPQIHLTFLDLATKVYVPSIRVGR